MFKVTVVESFASAHFLKNYKGKCENIHGHNYKVEVTIKGDKLKENFILEDFVDLKNNLRKVLQVLDHRILNDIEFFKNTNSTSEMIAKYIYNELKKIYTNLYSVKVWETEKQFAEYYEE